jgi:acetylornithine deacetylase/succinyl-diaminopimelate desuccinylase-like protein
MTTWADYLDENFERHVAQLAEFVSIPSVSALPEHSGDVLKAAEWVKERLQAAGMENTAVMPTGGHPVVYGDWLHAPEGAPTILIYGHFDVQPADPLDLWTSPPFKADIRDGRMFGRGASDDKGGMLTPIMAIEALVQSEGGPPVNLKFCFEGQEEIGSPQMGRFLTDHSALFAADLVLSADGLMWSDGRPMIVLGYKGLVGLEITVTGPSGDLHSGLHGGIMQNPIEALSRIISTFRSADGRIAIEGFFDDVREHPAEERTRLAAIGLDEEAYRQQLGIGQFFGEPGYTTLERNWLRPTLELNGIWGGFQGEGAKTVIPSQAHAKVTCRLVQDQDPEKIYGQLQAHVTRHTPPGVRVSITRLPGSAEPYLIASDHPANVLARQVLAESFSGGAPVDVYVGGSIPICTYFRRSLGADMLNFGWSVGDENLHAPNEFIRLENFRRGAHAYCRMLKRLAAAGWLAG